MGGEGTTSSTEQIHTSFLTGVGETPDHITMLETREVSLENDKNRENTKRPKGDENDDSMTLKEFLVKQRELELEAAAALPFRFDKCSAELGPLRQNLHICHNCPSVVPNNPLAFCYSCAITCHNFDPENAGQDNEDVLDGYGDEDAPSHSIEEIWSRKNFLCDCPSTGHCKLLAKVPDAFNSHKNSRHRPHNFSGRYCFCDGKGWAAGDRTMYQCEICEDWFHDDCVGRDHQNSENSEIPSEDSFNDFICRSCVIKHDNLFSKISPNSLIFTVPKSSKLSSAPLFLVSGWRENLYEQTEKLGLNLNPEIEHLVKDEVPVYEPEVDSEAKESLYDRKKYFGY